MEQGWKEIGEVYELGGAGLESYRRVRTLRTAWVEEGQETVGEV